ncbi:MAG: hypothetical protein Kow00121_11850 [Elainellaceae cyanobacterium]
MENSTPTKSTNSPDIAPAVDSENRQEVLTTISGTKPSSPLPSELSNLTPAKRQRFFIGLLEIGIIAVGGFGYHWWHYASTHQSTDDAYVVANIHPINARVSGTVNVVLVDDNQNVSQGEVLVKLDPHDYQVALQQAQASLAT